MTSSAARESRPPAEVVSLTTDYGLADGFVAACHGVIARLAPTLRVIDVTHLVPPGDVRRGAAVLAQTVPHLPPGVHVAVVDPGVGTSRRAVPADRRRPGGRPGDAGTAARTAGPPGPDGFVAEVLTVDHFGNVQLAAPAELLDPLPARVRVCPATEPTAPGADEDAPAGVGGWEREAVHGRTFGDAPVGAWWRTSTRPAGSHSPSTVDTPPNYSRWIRVRCCGSGVTASWGTLPDNTDEVSTVESCQGG